MSPPPRWRKHGAGLAVLLISAASAQIPPDDCLLTLQQEVAIATARDKLLDCAYGSTNLQNAGWGPNDPRWGALIGLQAWYYWGRFAPESKNKIRNDHIAPARGMTKPTNGRLSTGQWETICLDKNTWEGPNQDRYGDSDPIVACWLLAGVLLHEFSHSYDDNYTWPAITAQDRKAHACAEEEGYCWEIEILDKGASSFGENPPEILLKRIKTLASLKTAAARDKEVDR
ncbi:MAG: hypothetical protein AB7I19_01180 [Planctomycetota bacterium]